MHLTRSSSRHDVLTQDFFFFLFLLLIFDTPHKLMLGKQIDTTSKHILLLFSNHKSLPNLASLFSLHTIRTFAFNEGFWCLSTWRVSRHRAAWILQIQSNRFYHPWSLKKREVHITKFVMQTHRMRNTVCTFNEYHFGGCPSTTESVVLRRSLQEPGIPIGIYNSYNKIFSVLEKRQP